MLVSCVHKNEGPKFETHKLAYALYKPINYDGSNSLYVDTTRIVEGLSNVPTDANLAFTPDVIRCSIPIAVKNAIKTEGYDCVGLANVKVYNVQCGTHGVFYFACKVKGNPVYKKH